MILRLNVVVSVTFVTVCLCQGSSAQSNEFPRTPCPEVFQYMRNGNTNIGIITINDVSYGMTTVAIELSQHGFTKLNYPGQLSLNFNSHKIYEYLDSGRPLTFRVDFPLQNVIPQVTSIKLNDVQICSGPAYDSPRTSMKLEYTFNVYSSRSNSPQQFVPSHNTKQTSKPIFNQGSTLDSNLPEFLKYSQSFFNLKLSNPSSLYQPTFDQPSYNQPSFDQPSYTQPSNNQPSFDQPSYNQPSNNQPSFNQPSYNQPSNNQPSFDQPSFTQPSNFKQSNFHPSKIPPKYAQQPNRQPAFIPPSYSQPSNIPPKYIEHSYTQPFFTTPPSYSQPSNIPPKYTQPSYTQVSNTPPLFSQHKLGFPSFNQPSFNTPSFNQIQPSTFDKPTFSSTPPQPARNQQNSVFLANPQNLFLNISAEIYKYRPGGVQGSRNPQPSFEPPSPIPALSTEPPSTPIAPGVLNPISPSPTTINSNPNPSFGIDIRNPNPPTTLLPEPETSSTDRATIDYINSVCGKENLNIDVTKLNVKGSNITKSRFPWIVAVFRRTNNDDDLNFRCGGSLISTRTVVSAAHCFYLGFEPMKPEDILISMGRHNLTDSLDANNIDAESLILHPDYKPSQIHYDADLAIVRLKASVTFTLAVRPICMWQGNNDAREIVGMTGAIVGWGSDGTRKTTTVPTLVNATVVAEITCIRSNERFLALTSNRTLCAGNLDKSGPCMGDSGNGLMIKNRNKWMLRGTVSAGLGSATQQCLLEDYVIYSDIAMFIEWIQSNMLL